MKTVISISALILCGFIGIALAQTASKSQQVQGAQDGIVEARGIISQINADENTKKKQCADAIAEKDSQINVWLNKIYLLNSFISDSANVTVTNATVNVVSPPITTGLNWTDLSEIVR